MAVHHDDRAVPAAPPRNGAGTLGAQIAGELEREIRARGLPPGHLLGSEAELTGRFGVGAAAVREASRILQSRGVAKSRRGPGGGLFVTTPERRVVTDAARLYLEHTGVERAELFEVWLALEQVAVARLAGTLDADGALHLRQVLAREDGSARTWRELPNIHLVIARLAGNPALELFIQVLSELSLSRYGPTSDPRRAAAWLHERHTEIVESIIAGDAPMAQLHLRRFVEQVARYDA